MTLPLDTTDYSYERVAGDYVLRVKDVGVAYGDKVVLRDVNAEILNITRRSAGIAQGQVVALLGPSGIGKTQLFRVIAGLQLPGAKLTGEVLLGSNGTPVSTGLVGVIAQNYPLFEHRTVRGNLLIVGKGTKEDKEKAETLLAEFDLAQHADKYPAALSGGQRQRTAIAQQMMCYTHFMLMDEPFSGLDPLMTTKTIKLINKVTTQDEYNTTILVTHDISSAIIVSDTIWVMGRDRDAQGEPVPGARIVREYDLAKMGLCWRPDVRRTPEYVNLNNELRELFKVL